MRILRSSTWTARWMNFSIHLRAIGERSLARLGFRFIPGFMTEPTKVSQLLSKLLAFLKRRMRISSLLYVRIWRPADISIFALARWSTTRAVVYVSKYLCCEYFWRDSQDALLELLLCYLEKAGHVYEHGVFFSVHTILAGWALVQQMSLSIGDFIHLKMKMNEWPH